MKDLKKAKTSSKNLDKFSRFLLQLIIIPILILINNINCPNYKIRKKVLTALEKLTDKKEFKISLELVKNQIFNLFYYIKLILEMELN